MNHVSPCAQLGPLSLHGREALLNLRERELLHELEAAEHVAGRASLKVRMVVLHLGEQGPVRVCHEVEPVAARSCEAQDAVPLVVLKHEMGI